jgi:hypothetical protein
VARKEIPKMTPNIKTKHENVQNQKVAFLFLIGSIA